MVIYTVNASINSTLAFAIMKKDCIFFLSLILYLNMATSKTWIRTLDPDSGPWTQNLKNLDPEKHGKQLDMDKWLEGHRL